MSPYVHILIVHIPQYLFKYGQIGLFSLQPLESLNKAIKWSFKHLSDQKQDWIIKLLQRQSVWLCLVLMLP